MRLVAYRTRGTPKWTHFFHVPDFAWAHFTLQSVFKLRATHEYAEVCDDEYREIIPDIEANPKRKGAETAPSLP
jgi:hypothetical protein